jgi:feruloyl esterase
MRNLTFVVSIGVAASCLLMPANASAQAFADVANALVDYSKAEREPRKACDAMGRFTSEEIGSIKVEMVAAGAAAPAYCKVTGTLTPEIAFEVSLPAQWNGRFYMIGNGGFVGDNLDNPGRAAQRHEALRLGFAFAQTNTGHDAQKEPGASFVMSDPQKAIDYAYRAVHLTAVTGKAVTKDYYGRSASRSYWNSCSNGGRQGLIEAQPLSRRFRRRARQRTVGGADRLRDGCDVESARDQPGAPHGRQAGIRRGQGDGQMRRDRRAEGRPHRRSAQVRVRSGARRAGVQPGH